MKRVLCALAIGATAFVAAPADAATDLPVSVSPVVTENVVGVGVFFNDQPVAGAYVYPHAGKACVGIGDQIPLCADLLQR